MGIHATEDLTALCGQPHEPWRSNHYDFDEYQVVVLAWQEGYAPAFPRWDLGKLITKSRQTFTTWEEARQACLKVLNRGDMCKLLGRVFN